MTDAPATYIELPNGSRVNSAFADQGIKDAAAKGTYKTFSDPTPGSDSPVDTSATRTPVAPRVNPDNITADPSDPGSAQSFADFQSSRDLSPDEVNKISDVYTTRLKDQTDAITSAFADKSARQVDANAAEVARTRVLNAKGGNIDSGTGATALDTVNKKGNAALDAIDHEKEAAIESAIGQIDDLKMKQIQTETLNKQNDLTAYNNQIVANRKTAEATLTSLAKANVDISKLQDDKQNPDDPNEPSSFETLAKTLGLSPLELTAKYNAMKTTPITYQYITDKDGMTYGYGIDPVTKQLVETPKQQIEGLQPGDTLTTTAKGDLVIKTNTGAYKPAVAPKPAASTKPIKDGSLTTTQDEIAQGDKLLQTGGVVNGIKYNPVGADGYVDPGLYNAVYDQWRAKGGTVSGFVKYYPPKNYVNPASNSTLPAPIRNTAKAAPSSATTGA